MPSPRLFRSLFLSSTLYVALSLAHPVLPSWVPSVMQSMIGNGSALYGLHIPAPHLIHGFNIELVAPRYNNDGLFTSAGGVIWSEDFHLQARTLKQFHRPDGIWIEASGDLMLFYHGYLLTGQRLLFNLSDNRGTLYGGSVSVGSWYIGGQEIELGHKKVITIDKVWISADPSRQSVWNIEASQALIEPKKSTLFKHVTYRLHGLPLLYLPYLENQEGGFRQPIEWDFVWRGSRKRKIGLRYCFLKNPQLELWSRVEYHIGRGPGIGLDGHYSKGPVNFDMSNLAAKDATILNTDLSTRYRFKGHFHRTLSPTAQANLYYDRYSDSEALGDYSFTSFDRREAGETKASLRDERKSFLHQVEYKVRINPFQTVKCELPSYYTTLHPLYLPRRSEALKGFVTLSHARMEYLAYDFQSRSPLENYHSMRALYTGSISYPKELLGVQLTPRVGLLFIGYNNNQLGQGSFIASPTAQLYAQKQWYSVGKSTHQVSLFSGCEVVGQPQSPIDNHFLFDYRDVVTKSRVFRLGVRQHWYDNAAPQAMFEVQWLKSFLPLATGQSTGRLEAKGWWLLNNRSRFVVSIEWPDSFERFERLSLRSENTWSPQLATSFEYLNRSATSWRKSSPGNFSLESLRSKESMLNSDLSNPSQTFLTQINYKLSPNWTLRLDTTHGWNRSLAGEKESAYQQYCFGFGTDLGGNWRLLAQISRTPTDIDYRFRLDLHEGAVKAPKPHF